MHDKYLQIFHKADVVFLSPSSLYSWEEIINGAPVRRQNGCTTIRQAVEKNTWRGFWKIDKNGPGAKDSFAGFFLKNKQNIIASLQKATSSELMNALLDAISTKIKSDLRNVQRNMLASYNKVRKPVDLYIEHLVAMSQELSPHRTKLISLIPLPIDSHIVGSPLIFRDSELSSWGLKRDSKYSDVKSISVYNKIQSTVRSKAKVLSTQIGRPFYPIYFDLVWSSRYSRWGGNLFETNPD